VIARRREPRPSLVASLATLLATCVATLFAAAAPASAQSPPLDHLSCFKIRDRAVRAAYTANLETSDPGIALEPGCKVKVPATMLCVDTSKTGVSPPPPGAADGPSAGRYLCYTVKCDGTRPDRTLVDQFGTHPVTVGPAKMLCAPVSDPSPTPTPSPTPGPTPTPAPPAGGLFEAPAPWNQRVDGLPKSASSDAITSWLASAGGFGLGRVQIDFSMRVLTAGPTTPFVPFTQRPGYYLPDCDTGFSFPLPAGGAVEGESGYACTSGGDCHLLVVHPAGKKLYEMYQADVTSGVLRGQCAVAWDLAKTYPDSLRGEQCTSTDAAGLPVAALLFNADEVAAGDIPHAIRFILPNSRMRAGVYVRPATHAGAPSAASPNAPPYGVRFRLRADYPLASLPNDAARTIARAMQRYGMILADGGSVALTAASDADTTAKWADLGVDSRILDTLLVSDFEVVGLGSPITLTYDCVRNP